MYDILQNSIVSCQKLPMIFQALNKKKYDPANLILYAMIIYAGWVKKKVDKKSADITSMASVEADEEKEKEGREIKILPPDKPLAILSALLAQIKAGNNLCKLKNQIRKILDLLCKHNKNKNLINSLQQWG